MPNYRLRESILSLVMSPEHAATVVGDMVEEGRGTFPCWTAIASLILHALTPGLLGLALAGFLAQFLHLALYLGSLWLLGPTSPNHWRMLYWFYVLVFLANQLATGYWIGCWDQRRPLLLVFLVVVLDCTAGAFHFNNASINMAIWSIPLLAGTIAYRRYPLSSTSALAIPQTW